jgi:hypothetical protein
LARKENRTLQAAERAKWKKIHKAQRTQYNNDR